VEVPEHDPKENVTLTDLSDISAAAPSSKIPTPFYPYPNQSSFLLGDWFWNGGIQKSQESFKDLLTIITNPEFNPTDVKNTRWDHINRKLGSDESEHEWSDEDAGWISTPVTISVPFQARRGIPSPASAGPRDYTIPAGPRDYTISSDHSKPVKTQG
jgi:hypothetical protein